MEYNYDFGKLNENRDLEYAPKPLPINDNTWTNDPTIHLEMGYYPVQRTESPQKEGYYYTSYWEFEDGVIVEKWEEHEEPEPVEPDVATDEEIQTAIREGVNSIDS